jgi:hypothetical protein
MANYLTAIIPNLKLWSSLALGGPLSCMKVRLTHKPRLKKGVDVRAAKREVGAVWEKETASKNVIVRRGPRLDSCQPACFRICAATWQAVSRRPGGGRSKTVLRLALAYLGATLNFHAIISEARLSRSVMPSARYQTSPRRSFVI